jgi:hypothetical protein
MEDGAPQRKFAFLHSFNLSSKYVDTLTQDATDARPILIGIVEPATWGASADFYAARFTRS